MELGDVLIILYFNVIINIYYNILNYRTCIHLLIVRFEPWFLQKHPSNAFAKKLQNEIVKICRIKGFIYHIVLNHFTNPNFKI